MDGREIAIRSARILDDMKASNILVYDLRKSTDISDYFVIGTVTGPAHMTGIVTEIVKDLKTHGEGEVRCDNQNMSQWVLMDCVDCVIHLFSPELREYYSLESLWGDSDTLDWQELVGAGVEAAESGGTTAKPKAKKKRAPAKKRRAPAKA
ncbi:MAG TPA: ribosome silencing factor [Planctomycetota bacterium]|nr:ribosome silencing factor [Planctomycetota bacterium]